jgi:putative phosphoesterase
MMRIAVFSDVHANLPAFEAFLKNVDEQMPDAIYCLGDLVGYNVWPNEVIIEMRRRRIASIAGNHDWKVKSLTSEQSEKNYAYHLVDRAGREYLKTLPSHLRLEYHVNEKPLSMLLVHGSPRAIDEYLLEDLPEKDALGLLSEYKAQIIFCGHSHKPYHRVLKAEDEVKHIINVGSVGKPKDGDPRGCYVMLTLSSQSIDVEMIRFDYDIEKAANAIELSPLPNELAERLRKAF